VKRLRRRGAERARAGISTPWQSRAGPSANAERPSGAELARLRKRRQAQCFRATRPTNFEHPGGGERVRAVCFERPSRAERARAAISSAPAEPSGLEVANVDRFAVFEPGRAALSPRASKRSKAPCRKFQSNIFVCVILSSLIAPYILLRVALQAPHLLSALPKIGSD
jgi:hypothetical protein